MHFFYLLALVPILIGLFFWFKNKDVIWWEWVAGSVIALALAGIFHLAAINAQCADKEIFSGKIVSATHHPYWQSRVRVEDYETETYEDSEGNVQTRRVHTGYHYEYSNHPEYWSCTADYGAYGGLAEYEIDRTFFNEVSKNLSNNKLRTTSPWKMDFYSGDSNEYVVDNLLGFIYPTTMWKSFRNKIKVGPSLYSYAPVPNGVKVYPYPSCGNRFASDRLIGTAKNTISTREFDLLCSSVGPSKKVNLIMIGFGDQDSTISRYQEASWIGGKKNDIVICYGGKDQLKPEWVYAFGWTDRKIVLANLQSILLSNPVDTKILPFIEAEINKNYQIKEWKDFDYLQVEPPTWSYVVYIIVLVLAQTGFWFWANKNEFTKFSVSGFRRY